MYVIRRPSVDLLATLLAATVFFMGSNFANAQENTRYFQMALWSDSSLSDPSLDNGDIRTFSFSHESQPPDGPTIMVNYSPLFDYNLKDFPIDWSRVVAVVADEPYNSTQVDSHLSSCNPQAFSSDMADIDTKLQGKADELKGLAPKARFWVNFTNKEANWIVRCGNPAAFNRGYIDVISADWSADGDNNNIDTIKPFLSIVAANPPPSKLDQQLALIPGVYSAPVNQLRNLQGFFGYANSTNQVHGCNLPLGTRGITGISDGCPIWMVLGWFSGQISDGHNTYVGMLEPVHDSELIKKSWEQELHLPLAPVLAHQRTPAQLMQPALQLLLH